MSSDINSHSKWCISLRFTSRCHFRFEWLAMNSVIKLIGTTQRLMENNKIFVSFFSALSTPHTAKASSHHEIDNIKLLETPTPFHAYQMLTKQLADRSKRMQTKLRGPENKRKKVKVNMITDVQMDSCDMPSLLISVRKFIPVSL